MNQIYKNLITFKKLRNNTIVLVQQLSVLLVEQNFQIRAYVFVKALSLWCICYCFTGGQCVLYDVGTTSFHYGHEHCRASFVLPRVDQLVRGRRPIADEASMLQVAEQFDSTPKERNE